MTLAALFFAAAAAHGAHDADHLLPQTYWMAALDADWSDADDGTLFTWEGEAWLGDRDKLWLKTEGESLDGDVADAEAQFLYRAMISEFWDVYGGLRYDFEPESRGHAVAGLTGTLPYFVETDAALFLSDDGALSARIEHALELHVTQDLILEPHVEFNLSGRDRKKEGVGAGLTDIEAGLKLAYRITPEIAPYLDLVWERAVGETAILARAAGEDVEEATLRIGLSVRF